jgi:hypothetical protein
VPRVTQPAAPAPATPRTGVAMAVIMTGVLIGLFVVIEQRQPEPMLPLSIFRIPTMTASLLASLFQGLASFAVLFLVIMYLQGPRRLAFAIFVGSTSLRGTLAVAFTAGLHAAFYAMMGFMVLAAGLSALRAGSAGTRGRAPG